MLRLFSRDDGTHYHTKPMSSADIVQLDDRQRKVEGFDPQAMRAADIVFFGAGGIGSPAAMTLARKGPGKLTFIDDDNVEVSNLSRQWFDRNDVGKNKAERLARAISCWGMFDTELVAYPLRFQQLADRPGIFDDVDLFVCGVDNNPTRRAVAEFAIAHAKPVIFAAVSRAGNESYVFVQEPGKACWGCAFPTMLDDNSYPCQLPGIADSLLIVAGQIVYAVDSIIGDRPRHWNLRETFNCGALNDRATTKPRRSDCPLCGHFSNGA